jgi:hypothetical protein
MRRMFVFPGVFFLHLILQFAAWSYADSTRTSSAQMRVLFTILATPIVLICGLITDEYFWIPMIANSVLWAAIATYVVTRYGGRRTISL